MKPTTPHDSELMALHDGELDEATSRALETRLSRPQRDKVEGLDELGDLVRSHLELTADAVPAKRFDALWREIDKAIDREAAAAAPVATPIQAPSTVEAVPAGVWVRVTRWFERYRGHVLTGAVSAGAVAALALLLRGPGLEERPRGSDLANTAGSGGSAGSGVVVASHGSGSGKVEPQLVTHQPTEIESLDTPGGTGTVFNLEDEDGSTTVIWVTPEDTVEGI